MLWTLLSAGAAPHRDTNRQGQMVGPAREAAVFSRVSCYVNTSFTNSTSLQRVDSGHPASNTDTCAIYEHNSADLFNLLQLFFIL